MKKWKPPRESGRVRTRRPCHNCPLRICRRIGFTLIERMPRNNENTRRMKGSAPVRRPSQTGSQAAERTRSAVTTSRERNSSIEGELVVSQSGEANSQAAGKRTTVSIVKGTLAGIADRAREQRVARMCSIDEAPAHGERDGKSTHETRRCKRWRHVRKANSSNWGGPAQFRVNRGKTIKRVDPLPQPEATTATSLWRFGKSRCHRKRGGIRTTSENRRDAVLGVGDAHSSEDRGDSKTLWERRGISLKRQANEERSG